MVTRCCEWLPGCFYVVVKMFYVVEWLSRGYCGILNGY